ncbi:MAG: hypothetical protein COB50_01940 [Thiotrichales bacterium]|nr:MAG: hypothetical protein COB50_01940 [Thiotrichales bacterium]
MFKRTITVLSLVVLSGAVLQSCAPVIIVGAAAAGASTAGDSRNVSSQFSDNKIRIEIMDIVTKTPELQQSKSNVEITVFNGNVLLIGQVPEQRLKTDLSEKAHKIKGVKKVYNKLIVGKSINFKNFSGDSWITTKVKAQMLGKVNPLNFKVITERGTVYILAITTQKEGIKAAKIASRVSGVKKVITMYSYITAKAPTKDTTSKDTDSKK